ncbi:MAG TPA: hypothetical protein VJT77_07515 [Burkholderiales bacterium]|nr:hypothetical protein [Burkholderiales bacterium]
MGLLDKMLGRDVDDFAKELAQMVAKRFPPALEKSPERRVSPNRITKVLEDALEKAADYGKSRRLGMYKKARLANAFKWQLKDLGYSDNFIEVATEGLVVYLTRGPAKEQSKPSG